MLVFYNVCVLRYLELLFHRSSWICLFQPAKYLPTMRWRRVLLQIWLTYYRVGGRRFCCTMWKRTKPVLFYNKSLVDSISRGFSGNPLVFVLDRRNATFHWFPKFHLIILWIIGISGDSELNPPMRSERQFQVDFVTHWGLCSRITRTFKNFSIDRIIDSINNFPIPVGVEWELDLLWNIDEVPVEEKSFLLLGYWNAVRRSTCVRS